MYFGDGLYGVEAAARGYFGRSASDLTVDQAALLAGLIQSPSSYAPTVNLDRAVARRNVVLQTMVSSGAIDEPTAARAKKAPVKLTNALEIKETFGLYFKEQVRRELVERFGWQRVYQGGLRVFTTMQPEMQKAAEALRRGRAARISRSGAATSTRRAASRRLPRTGGPTTCRVRCSPWIPTTGFVEAMVGGRDVQREPVQPRRPGQAPVRVGLQAVRLRRGPRSRVIRPPALISNLERPVLTAAGRLGARRRAFRRQLE